MARAFGLLVMLGALWVGMNLYREGVESAYGGIFASSDSAPAVAREGSMPEARSAAPVTQRVRDRVTADLEGAARRHAGDVD